MILAVCFAVGSARPKPQDRRPQKYMYMAQRKQHMSCHVMSLRRRRFAKGLRGWVSAYQRPLSRAMRSRLAPDWSVHATMLSIQHVLGLPRFLVPPYKTCHHAAFNVVVW